MGKSDSDKPYLDGELMKAFAIVMCGLFASAAAVGCGPWRGHVGGPSDFEYVNPAVQWAYEPGEHVRLSVLLCLPWICGNYFENVELGDGCLVITESTGDEDHATAWYPRKSVVYAISLKDGSHLPQLPESSHKIGCSFSWQPSGDYDVMQLPDGRIMISDTVVSVDAPDEVRAAVESGEDTGPMPAMYFVTSISIGPKDGQLIELVRYKWSHIFTRCEILDDGRILIVSEDTIMCVDPKLLNPQQPACEGK